MVTWSYNCLQKIVNDDDDEAKNCYQREIVNWNHITISIQ